MIEKLLTIDELAQELRVKKSWIYSRTRMKGSGAILHLKVGKYLRFCLEDVLTWVKVLQDNK